MGYREFLSKRNTVMAFAILWIMLYHTHLVTGFRIIDHITGIGYAGSDIFYFVSGMGIWFSLERSGSIWEYYKKRLLRIMPMWWCFIWLWIAFRMIWFDLSALQAVTNIFAVESFFDIDHAFNWYISFLLVFYLIAPALKRLMEALPGVSGILLICIIFILLGYFAVDDKNIMIGFSRVPVFSLGMYFGGKMCKKPEGGFSFVQVAFWLALAPVGLLGAIYFGRDFLAGWHDGMLWYPLLISVPGLYMLICLIFRALPDFWERPFDFIGRHTLSIYLVHIFIFEIYEKFLVGFGKITPALWHWPVILCVVAIGCVALEAATAALTGRCRS